MCQTQYKPTNCQEENKNGSQSVVKNIINI